MFYLNKFVSNILHTPGVKRWLSLFGILGVVGLIWLEVLPRIASDPTLSQRSQELERKGIDPSAMFYSDLEVMDDISQKHKEMSEQEHSKMWFPSW